MAHKTNPIENHVNFIDSRDIIQRINYLESYDIDELTEEERDELTVLQSVAKQGEDYAADWQYGEQLIRDSYFKEYAQEMAYDCGMVPDNAQWPMTCIDWNQAARELKMDYTEIDFDGVTYWIR